VKLAGILFVVLGFPIAGAAQAPRIAPRASTVFAPSAPPAPGMQVNLPETHWKTGALVGGLGLGIFGAYAGYGLCMDSEDPTISTGACVASGFGGFLIGGLIGGVTGAMIGGLFPKGPVPGE